MPSDFEIRSNLAQINVALAMNAPTVQPKTVLEQVWQDFVFGEIWSRPGLPLRVRFLCGLASMVFSSAEDVMLEGFVSGALNSGALSLRELREVALHLCPYGGWMAGARLDTVISKIALKSGVTDDEPASPASGLGDFEQRLARSYEEYATVTMTPRPTPGPAPFSNIAQDFVFGEVWSRGGLDRRSRRWLCLVGTCLSNAEIAYKTHIRAALKSGDCTGAELEEFVMQYAIFHGWHRATIVQSALNEILLELDS